MREDLIQTDYDTTDTSEVVEATKVKLEKKNFGNPNWASLLSENEVKIIGNECMDGYRRDLNSREDWEKRYANSLKLALQVVEKKTFPWPDCSNVKFPLITVACLQYQAKAYPAIINGRSVYEGQVMGDDPDGEISAAAERIGNHMTWQCLHQDPTWEEETDKLFFVQSLFGCAFRKTWFDPVSARLRSKLVLPSDLVVNYFTRSLDESPRYTHRFYLSKNDIVQRIRLGLYTEQTISEPSQDETSTDEISEAEDKREGMELPEQDRSTPHLMGEQYCWYDFDRDGYAEPYIVTFEVVTGKVWRIAPRFLPSGVTRKNNEVVGITPIEVFTKYPFIPSPDNGFYDLGLGALVGPINDQVNGAFNQIFDAGTMATLGGGFVGRGFNSKGGPFSMRPFMWHPTDAPGDDLRKNILPLPVREPSKILFDLIGFLVQYAERIVSATEIQVGESPGQNMKAQTAEILNQNGARVFNAIYKRDWRSIRDEGLIRANLNKFFLEDDVDFTDLQTGRGITIRSVDYQMPKVAIAPAADPAIVSDNERKQQASMILQNAFKLPGHNRYQAMLRFYKSLNVHNIKQFLEPPQQPDPQNPQQMVDAKDYPQPPNPKMEEVKVKQAAQKLKEEEFHVEQKNKIAEMKSDAMRLQAEVMEKYAKAAKLMAEAKGVKVKQQIDALYAEIEAKKVNLDGLFKAIEVAQKADEAGPEGGQPAQMPALQGGSDQQVLAELQKLNAKIDGAMGPKMVTMPDGRKIRVQPGPNGSKKAIDEQGRVTMIQPMSQTRQ